MLSLQPELIRPPNKTHPMRHSHLCPCYEYKATTDMSTRRFPPIPLPPLHLQNRERCSTSRLSAVSPISPLRFSATLVKHAVYLPHSNVPIRQRYGQGPPVRRKGDVFRRHPGNVA